MYAATASSSHQRSVNMYTTLGLVLVALAFVQVNGACSPGKYLVTMEKKELIDVVVCVSESKDPLLCSKFAACERLMSPRVLFALEECKRKIVPEGIKRCTPNSVVFEKPEIPEKIFDCVVEKVDKVSNMDIIINM
ncbi:hypothetical protein AVEN_203773-1 [Araneus ventricosus]|uniref:Saposin B-type domain-containing protein n=1 Tax=Araneus ventricosus TaxID=182803 RepID=A0A4Y2IQ92_ARAVE|nr:hypothetical protein AVEN_203773-1 [Araneus ventricosus]